MSVLAVVIFAHSALFTKNLNAFRPSEHPQVKGKTVKTFRCDPIYAANTKHLHDI